MPTTRTKAGGAKPEPLFQPPPGQQPLAARMRPRSLDEFVGQEHLVGERGPLRRAVARGHLASLILWGPPGTGKTTPRPPPRGLDRRRHDRAVRGLVRGRRGALGRRRGPGAADAEREANRPVHRRDPPLQQGPAGRAPAVRRGRHDHLDGNDNREPVLRGQLRAPVADARLAARAARRRGRRDGRPTGADRRRSRAGRSRSGPMAASGSARTRSSTSSRSPAATRAPRSTSSRARSRSPIRRTSATRRVGSRRGSRTSRRPPSSGSSATTGPATATTTPSPRSSRASAATIRTPRSTGSPR